MKINRLRIQNFRGIRDVEIELEGKSAVLYGINGMGKSTVLEACNLLFSRILREASEDAQIEAKMIRETDIKLDEEFAKISGTIEMDGRKFPYYRSRRDGKNLHSAAELKKAAGYIRDTYVGFYVFGEEDEEEENSGQGKMLVADERNMPVYVFYGINRYIERRRLFRKKYTGAAGKLDAWRDDAFDGIINFDLFFEWFRGRQEYENSIRIEKPDFEDNQLKSAREAMLAALGGAFTAVKIRIQNDDAELIVTKNGQDFKVQQLSEGEKSMLALVGDLARRLSIANPNEERPLEGAGIVLIDEIDLHLHPAWQAKVLPTLLFVFPNIQFLATTHAPKVLGEIGEEVHVIRLKEEDGEVAAQRIEPLIGWDANTILQEYMDTNYRNAGTEKMVDEMYRLIAEGQYDEAEEIADRLAELTDEKNTDVVRGRILIAGGR